MGARMRIRIFIISWILWHIRGSRVCVNIEHSEVLQSWICEHAYRWRSLSYTFVCKRSDSGPYSYLYLNIGHLYIPRLIPLSPFCNPGGFSDYLNQLYICPSFYHQPNINGSSHIGFCFRLYLLCDGPSYSLWESKPVSQSLLISRYVRFC